MTLFILGCPFNAMWGVSETVRRGVRPDHSDQHLLRKLREASQYFLHGDGPHISQRGNLSCHFDVDVWWWHDTPRWDNSSVCCPSGIWTQRWHLFQSQRYNLSEIVCAHCIKNLFLRTLLTLNIFPLKKSKEISNNQMRFKSFTNI